MSSIYWFMIIFLLVGIIVTVVYIFVTRVSDNKCCYKYDDSYYLVLSPSPSGESAPSPSSTCHLPCKSVCGNNDRDFYAMIICLGVILALMITVFILFIYMSGGENKATPTPTPITEVATKNETNVLPSSQIDLVSDPTSKLETVFVSLPPPMMSSSEDYVRLGSLGCKKRSCRKSPKFKVVTD